MKNLLFRAMLCISALLFITLSSCDGGDEKPRHDLISTIDYTTEIDGSRYTWSYAFTYTSRKMESVTITSTYSALIKTYNFSYNPREIELTVSTTNNPDIINQPDNTLTLQRNVMGYVESLSGLYETYGYEFQYSTRGYLTSAYQTTGNNINESFRYYYDKNNNLLSGGMITGTDSLYCENRFEGIVNKSKLPNIAILQTLGYTDEDEFFRILLLSGLLGKPCEFLTSAGELTVPAAGGKNTTTAFENVYALDINGFVTQIDITSGAGNSTVTLSYQ